MGARFLSHGFDGAGAFMTGAWFSCAGSKLSYVEYVNGGSAVSPSPSGTGDTLVGCNWTGGRLASQGYDGLAAITYGADVVCNGTRTTSMSWRQNMQSQTGRAGDLGCNWSGAIFLSNGLDGSCAFMTGFAITCAANRITHFEFLENAGCPRIQ
jgi:hypothetical protein